MRLIDIDRVVFVGLVRKAIDEDGMDVRAELVSNKMGEKDKLFSVQLFCSGKGRADEVDKIELVSDGVDR